MEGRVRVLAIDDDANVRVLCRTFLSLEGMDVLEAGDGDEGLSIARRERPDVILLDRMMPQRDGLEILSLLKDDPRTSDLPVVVVSACATQQERREGMDAGAAAYITKPFALEELGRVVAALAAAG